MSDIYTVHGPQPYTPIKLCNKCTTYRSIKRFSKHSASKDRMTARCKACIAVQDKKWAIDNKELVLERQRKYRRNNKESVAETKRKWAIDNKEHVAETKRKYLRDNKEFIAEIQRKYARNNKEFIAEIKRKYVRDNKESVAEKRKNYQKENRHIVNAITSRHRAAKKQAVPNWYEHEEIKELYKQCQMISKETGIQHHVDHIIPLQHKLVCGLHCLDNLQIITAKSNKQKGNKFIV